MKLWVPGLVGMSLMAVIVQTKGQQCEVSGGVCIVGQNVQDSCRRLPFDCKSELAVCCKPKRQEKITKASKRKCRKTPKKCSKIGGVCQKPAECETTAIDKLCKGASCTCCTIDCKCGQLNKARVVGGGDVDPPNKYPWMVGIKVDGENSYRCGGSIIDERYILTAAHCLFDFITLEQIPSDNISVAVVDHNQFSEDDDIENVTRSLRLSSYVIPKKFNIANFVSKGNDISLLELKEPLDLESNDEIKPVCLPKKKKKSYEGSAGILAGWGLKDTSDVFPPSNLNEITLPIVGDDCLGQLNNKKISKKFICTGYTSGPAKGACLFDDGGPLVVEKGSSWTLVGIVSHYFSSCADNGTPTAYTRVSHFLKWISAQTEKSKKCTN